MRCFNFTKHLKFSSNITCLSTDFNILTMSSVIQLATCISVTLAIRIRIRNNIPTEEFSWENTLRTLTEKKALWEANGISEYFYQQTISCYCMDCYRMPKFVYIVDGEAKDVDYDRQTMRDQYGDYGAGLAARCNDSTLSKPISENFHTIDYWYDKAIEFAAEGAEANCTGFNSSDFWNGFGDLWDSMYCGGKVIFEYDETLHYPTKLFLGLGPMIADGDMDYSFGCLTVMNTNTDNMVNNVGTAGLAMDGYQGECKGYEPPKNSSDLCVCTYEWEPYCCAGREFGNKCHAECEGFYVYTQCTQSECGKPDDKNPGEKGPGGKGGDDNTAGLVSFVLLCALFSLF